MFAQKESWTWDELGRSRFSQTFDFWLATGNRGEVSPQARCGCGVTVSTKTRLLWFKIPFLLQRQKNIEEKKKQRGCVCHRFVSQYQKHKEAYRGVFWSCCMCSRNRKASSTPTGWTWREPCHNDQKSFKPLRNGGTQESAYRSLLQEVCVIITIYLYPHIRKYMPLILLEYLRTQCV